MVTTVNKGYELIVTGTELDTWGDTLNADVFEIIDSNLGGLVAKSLTNVNVTLSTTENQNLILRLTGTLTGNVLITTTLKGVMFVENLTSGAFAVTLTNGTGSPITLPQGARSCVLGDATNGARIASEAFPSGTRMLFQQSTAPTGWTKDTTHNNKALRLVSGSVVNGGSVDFTTAFASQSVVGTVGGTAITIAQMPAHSHEIGSRTDCGGGTGTAARQAGLGSALTTSTVGGGETHDHSFTGTAINLAVAYVDMIIAQKD
jgi:hypothetical protein